MGLYVGESGPPRADTIVFLHGASESAEMWRPQTEALVEYHCLALDLPGHGRSRALRWRSFADTAARVAEVVRERAHGGCAHLVGLSLGGYIALALLASEPERVRRVLISGVHARPFPRARLLALLAPLAALRSRDGTAPLALVRITREAVRYRLPELRRAGPPTLVVAGSDEIGLIRESVPVVVAALSQGEGRIVPGAGHVWSREQPDRFNALARAWLEDATLPADLVPA